jgi:protein-L-isoaspartate(D-aspartate) O-methyltransferase
MNFEQARTNMVQQQLRTWDVSNEKVLALMQAIPRENFVPATYKNLSYADTKIPLLHQQYMLEPKLEARIAQALAIHPDDHVLEIGTGTGYSTAIYAHLSKKVTSVDIYPEFIELARSNLHKFDISHVELKAMNGSLFASNVPGFDVIVISASCPQLPKRFCQQLNIGGRLFVIVGHKPAMQAWLITRVKEEKWLKQSLFETEVPSMIDLLQPEPFSF